MDAETQAFPGGKLLSAPDGAQKMDLAKVKQVCYSETVHNPKAQTGSRTEMEHNSQKRIAKRSLPWADTGSEKPALDAAALPPDGAEIFPVIRPADPWTQSQPKKKAAASAPGSEYWLP